MTNNYSFALYHSGVKSQKWYNRRYQNPDGTWTEEGKARRREARALKAIQAAYYQNKAQRYTDKANRLYVKYGKKAQRCLEKYQETNVSSIEYEFGEKFNKSVKSTIKGTVIGAILDGPIGAITLGSITAVGSTLRNGTIQAYSRMKNG